MLHSARIRCKGHFRFQMILEETSRPTASDTNQSVEGTATNHKHHARGPGQHTQQPKGIHFGSFQEWWQQEKDLPILDLRSEHDYKAGHIKGSIHIPLAMIRQRSYELPPRQNAFAVMIPGKKKTLALQQQQQEEHQKALLLIQEFFLCLPFTNDSNLRHTKKRRRSQQPWKVPLVLLDDDDEEELGSWKQQAKDLGMLECFGTISQDSSSHATTTTPIICQPFPRLWQPDPMIKDVLLPELAKRLAALSGGASDELSSDSPLNHGNAATHTTTSTSNNNVVYEIWDLGAGAGRDVCFLAEELLAAASVKSNTQKQQPLWHKFCVVGMDQRYRTLLSAQNNAKKFHTTTNHTTTNDEECLQFWRRRGVENVTRCVSVQWTNGANQHQEHETWFRQELSTSAGTWGACLGNGTTEKPTTTTSDGGPIITKKQVLCLYMVRFWNRSLMEFFATSNLLPAGILVAVSQFAKPYLEAPWNFEHPKEKHVLERNELRQLFCAENHWDILRDEIVQDSDHGRTLIQFVAVKSKIL